MASVISEASNRTSRTLRSTSQRFSNRSLGDFSLYDLIAEQSNTPKANESSDDPTLKTTTSDWESVNHMLHSRIDTKIFQKILNICQPMHKIIFLLLLLKTDPFYIEINIRKKLVFLNYY